MKGRLGPWLLLFASIGVIAYARPRAVTNLRAAGMASDIFALPTPSVLTALSLGYRSALADLLSTSTAVSYGIHHEEHRRFEFVGQYLDAIVALDPTFCQPYRYADTFITYQPVGSPSPEDARHARRLLEQGVETCSTDGHLHLSAGQFLIFIATQFLTDEAEKEQFRHSGAKMLARAAELSDNQNVQWQSLAAAGIFTREGQREAAIAFLERVQIATSDEELKLKVAAQLQVMRSQRDDEKRAERKRRHEETFKGLWRSDLPFVSATVARIVGPPYDADRCAGRGSTCASSWAKWPFGDPPE